MPRLNVFPGRALGLIVVDVPMLRRVLRTVRVVRRNSGHSDFLPVVDSNAAAPVTAGKQPPQLSVDRTSDGVRYRCEHAKSVLQASSVVDSRRPGYSPAVAHFSASTENGHFPKV